MAKQNQNATPSGNGGPKKPPQDLSALIERAIHDTETPKTRAIAEALQTATLIAKVEEVLPKPMKGQAARLLKRAILTFNEKTQLQACTIASFIHTVIRGAEAGLPVDGRLGHAVPYWNNDKKRYEAQFQADYKGLIAVARRSNLIKDCKADVVCMGDTFRAWREDERDRLLHEFNILQPRGEVVGAYAVLVLPGGVLHFEVMGIDELDEFRERTKSRDKAGNIVGPWATDTREMFKKTVIRRALKYLSEDPALAIALEVEDKDDISPASQLPFMPQMLAKPEPAGGGDADIGLDDLLGENSSPEGQSADEPEGPDEGHSGE